MAKAERAGPGIDVITGVCPHDCPDTCSFQVSVQRSTGRALDIWGDPDHPVNRGTLCPKGAALIDFIHSPSRLTHPEYRASGSDRWPRCT